MKSVEERLAESAALHHHLCPRQVLGVRMGLWAGELLDLSVPQADKRLLTIVETDGCFADGVAVATNCWVGRRTLRVEDYGKIAATFVDTRSGAAVRIAPHPLARQTAHNYAPEADGGWEAMLHGYQRMPVEELLVAQHVQLVASVEEIVSHAGRRVNCDRCGEEIINQREVLRNGLLLCRACAGEAYYQAVA
ncbi:MAG: formylmethanofuran dehydrogenase [Chloroflexi bacterium]|nr:MAG: formylmethanofuran dehydrogenase [Chloroflexota bacterium]